jgi:hypothetical protein
MIPFSTRVAYAFRCFFALLFHGEVPADILQAFAGEAAKPVSAPAVTVPPPKPALQPPDRAIQILSLLQRDGRLIDFLAEDVSPYPDSQLGAAVRTIHDSCKQVLDRYLKLEPVLNSEEDQPVALQNGFDPASVKLIGNVGAATPAKGILRHRGWRVREANLPSLPQGAGREIIAPAEVEVE